VHQGFGEESIMRLWIPLLIAAAAVLLAAACSHDDVVRPAYDTASAAYLAADHPINVITNLEAAYANRDVEAYAALFAPEFVFHFQQRDGGGSWGLEDELASARRMFTSPKVAGIEIRLQKLPVAAVNVEGRENTVLVRVAHTYLRIDQVDGTSLEVNGDRQDFYLRRVLDEGRDRWLITEWFDLPAGD
jgi:hypothetical protein